MNPFSITYAQQLEEKYPTPARDEFYIPQTKEGKPYIYFCGNSLGLQPKSTASAIEFELNQWKNLGVEGHFEGEKPWFKYHHFSKEGTAKLVGALPSEVVMMNGLTVNLHLMLSSFYRPTKTRFKILIENDVFGSDYYAIESVLRLHNLNVDDALIIISPKEGEYNIETSAIENEILKHGDSLALVLLGGVNYFTGQVFDFEKITETAHKVGAYAGFDLAHAVGNLDLQLHQWQVDFAVWCSYKYLNAGPGGVGGVFVHKNHENSNLPRQAGWWGHREEDRFLMQKNFIPSTGADGWQLSNAPVLNLAAYMASLQIFEKYGISDLRNRSIQLTGYLIELLNIIESNNKGTLTIITPQYEKQRGCQVSIILPHADKSIIDALNNEGIIADWRHPNVLRFAPVPLYNTFEEVYKFVKCLESLLVV